MAQSSATKSSTPHLSEAARHVVIPVGIVTTGWPSVHQKLTDLGIEFDPWQVDLAKLILAKNADGKYVTTIGGVVLSVPRQVGKTFTIGSLMFALCLLFPGTKVLWTAHRMRTAGETFMSMQVMSRRKRVAPYMLKPVLGSGDEEIRFRNGSRIMFGARERGFGLGMTNVDVLMFDEAQRLTESAIDDMVPSTNQATLPGGALLFFAGTPPRPGDPGEVFARKRREALTGLVDDTLFVEFSADKGAAPMDRRQWRIANPSFPKRTPEEAMLRMIRQLGPESIPREMYGIWDDADTKRAGAVDLARWLELKVTAGVPSRGQVTVDVAPDLDWTSVSVAAPGPDGRTLVLVDRFRGTDGAVEKVAGLAEDLAEVVEVALTPTAALFSDKLTARKITHKVLTNADLGRACSAFLVSTAAGGVAHVDQDDLNTAITNAITRYVGDAVHWDRRDRVIDISPVVAASTAAHRWALLTAAPKSPPPPPQRVTDRTVAHAGF